MIAFVFKKLCCTDVTHCTAYSRTSLVTEVYHARVTSGKGGQLSHAALTLGPRFPHRSLLTANSRSSCIELLVPSWNTAGAAGAGLCTEIVDLKDLRVGLPDKVW